MLPYLVSLLIKALGSLCMSRMIVHYYFIPVVDRGGRVREIAIKNTTLEMAEEAQQS